jgi:hypothetical protein
MIMTVSTCLTLIGRIRVKEKHNFMRTRRPPTYFQRRQFPRLWLILVMGLVVPAVLALVVGAIFIVPRLQSHAAAANGDCSLIVPPHPLTALGLATPYQLVATTANNGPCNEANTGQTAFVQATVIDPVTGKVSVYDPLVVDQGTQPAITPVMPTLPQQAIVGIWFGFNGNNLTLQDSNGSLQQGHCVNGLNGSIFGQVAYCNAPAFFSIANQAIQQDKLVPPAIGRAKDGMSCPTVRDFSLVDQDQSDNVTTAYLATGNGQIAQMTTANVNVLQGAQKLFNGSDNGLLDDFVDPALGCTPWMVPNLADAGNTATSLALDELQAAAHQAQPIALVPLGDPMVQVNGTESLNKVNAYRVGVDQPLAFNVREASTLIYCSNLLAIGPQRLLLDAHLTRAFASPDTAMANSLFTFLAQRFVTTYGPNELHCQKLTGQPDPVTVKTDDNGVAIDATINGKTISSPVSCSVNGTVLQGCTGMTTINGQTCTFTFDGNAKQVNITCPQGTATASSQ